MKAIAVLPGKSDSVHLAVYPGVADPAPVARLHAALEAEADTLLARYEEVREVRRAVNAALEEERRQKRIGSSMEAKVILEAPASQAPLLREVGLADLLIVSAVEVRDGGDGLRVQVQRASGTKCARCWLYREDVGLSVKHPTLCKRCVEAI